MSDVPMRATALLAWPGGLLVLASVLYQGCKRIEEARIMHVDVNSFEWAEATRKQKQEREEKTVHLSDETIEKLADAIARRSGSLTVDADAIARAVKSGR